MRRALCVGLWTMLGVCAAPLAVSHAQGVRVETKGLPDGGNGRITRTMVPTFGEKLDLTLDLNIQFVPLQPDLDRVEAQVQLAQQILCDATDGRVDLVRIRANLGRAAAEHSDIWWRRGLQQTSHAGNHVVLNEANFDGPTLAHELGHYVLNLRDSYANRSGTDGCEWGPAFEPVLRTALANTIMESGAGRVCVDQMGRTHDRVDPVSFVKSVPCTTDAQCPADGAVEDTNGVMLNWTCELDPFGSELGTRVNQDFVLGDFSTRAPSDPTWTGECPNDGTPSTQLVMFGRFVNPISMSTCGNGVLDPSEECQDDGRETIPCDETGRPGAAGWTGTADCFLCRWETSTCVTTSCNSDGVIDPGEECDTTNIGATTCETLGLGTGTPYCHPNCTFGTATCIHPALDFDLTSYESLRGSQIENEDIWLLDEASRIGHRWKRGESEHRLRAYANRISTDHWTLLFVMDGGEFTGGAAPETPQEIARFDLEFDAMNALASINGLAVDADGCNATAGCPSLLLGSNTAAAPYGMPTSGASGQTLPTGTWTPMDDGTVAGELVVQLDLSNVTRESFQRPTGGNAAQGFLRATLQDDSGLPPIGLCANDNWCRVSWNQATQRFESTEQTRLILTDMINTGASLMTDADMDGTSDLARTEERADWFRLARTWGVPEAMVVEAGTPAISTCGATAATVDFGDVEVPGQFVMVLDRSGSMEAQAPDSTETRLEMMQDAARNTVNLHSNKRSYDPGLSESNGSPCNDGADGDGDGMEDPKDSDCQRATRVGLVTFNDQTCVDPSGGAVCVQLAEIGTGMMQTPPATYIDAIDRLQPFGWTGIGLAMRAAEAQLDVSSAQRKALLVLSDGENNRPEGILCKPPADLLVGEVNDPACPFAVAEDLRRQGVLVITIPLGSSTDSFGMQEIADITGGEMLSAYRDDEVIPVFLHAYALSRAEKPVIARRDVLLIQSGGVGVFQVQASPTGYAGVDEVTIPVPVEQGAQRLNLLLSVRSQSSATWAPTFELRDPSGALVLTETDGRVRISATSRSISVDDPTAGQWSIVVHPTFTVEQSHFAAQVENPLPGCSLQLSTHVTDGSQPVIAKLEAYYDTALHHEDVSYSLVVRSIDGTVNEITTFDTSDPDGPAIAVLDPATIQYHGRYDILGSCRVGDLTNSAVSAAIRRRGEVPGSAEVFEVESDPIPAFEREDRATLSVVNGNWPPVTNCPNNDCDNDGILNPDESPDDLDGDGAPGPWDDNADGDEVTDRNDPDPNDPSVPGVPPHPGCSTDTDPPVIDAPDRTVSGCVGAIPIDPRVDVRDASCPNDALIDVTGRLLLRNGEAYDSGASFEPNALVLPAGEYVFEWTATDVNGNAATASQTLTVTADSSSAACCPEGTALFEGNGLPNLFILPRAGNKCVLGRGSWDAILTGPGTDYLSGGSGSDFIESRGTNDTLTGGPGRDLLLLPVGASGTIYGEGGDDALELTGTGVIFGGPGDDVMLGAFGNQAFTPGPGRDVVIAASGDDVVRIYDPCELAAFELLDGGSGNDTLFTPVPVVELLARGVIVVGFENIIVSTADRHLSECQ